MKKMLSVLLVLTFVFSLTACTKPAIVEEPGETGGTFLHWVYWEQPHSNPVLSTGTFAHSFVFDPLVQVDENANIQPRLAEDWGISDDGLVYTFSLRKNVKWHDGQPFTADDVKFTYDAIMDPKTITTQRNFFIMGDEKIECEVVDEHTVKFTLPYRFSPFLGKIGDTYNAVRIIPKHLLEGKDINSDDFNFNPVGTGPFKMQERKPGEYAILVKNEDYFLPVLLDQVVLKVIPNAEANVAAFENKELHNTYLYDADVEKFSTVPGVVEYKASSGSIAHLWLNIKNPLFSDKQVRKAIAHALDRDAIAKTVTFGLTEEAAHSIYTDTGPHAWVYNSDLPRYEFDQEKAKQILEDLGWKPDAAGILAKDGKRFEFTLIGQTGFAQYEKVNTMIQAQLAEIGIKMEIRLLEPAAFRESTLDTSDPKPMAAHVTGSGAPSYDPDYYDLYHSSQYPGGRNVYGYANARVDELLMQGRSETDLEKRREIYLELQSIIMDEIPYIPLYELKDVVAVWDTLGGVPEDTSKDAGITTWYYPERLFIKEK